MSVTPIKEELIPSFPSSLPIQTKRGNLVVIYINQILLLIFYPIECEVISELSSKPITLALKNKRKLSTSEKLKLGVLDKVISLLY